MSEVRVGFRFYIKVANMELWRFAIALGWFYLTVNIVASRRLQRMVVVNMRSSPCLVDYF